MPNTRTLKRSLNVFQLGFSSSSGATQVGNATTGVWNLLLTSGLYSYRKAAAATTSVIAVPIPHGPKGGLPTNEDGQVSIVELFYAVTTANLTSAPTVAANRHTFPGGTGTGFVAVTVGTPAPTLTFAGVDGVGTAAGAGATGSHIAVATYATPYNFIDTDSLILTFTMNEAATSVLDIFGVTVTYV